MPMVKRLITAGPMNAKHVRRGCLILSMQETASFE
jgi:hypothetical protein